MKQSPEIIDFGQKLARRRSQDFASKVQGWNETGAGVLPKQDAVEVVEKPKKKKQSKKEKEKESWREDEDKQESRETENEEGKSKPEIVEADEEGDGGVVEREEDVVVVTVDPVSTEPTYNTVEVKPDTNLVVPEITNAKNTEIVTPTGGLTIVKPETTVKKAGRDLDLRRGAWVRRKSKPQAELLTDVKHAGAPKKRIVSDGHWRRDRQPKEEKEPATPEKIITPKPITIKRSVVSVGLKIPPSTFSFTEPNSEPAKIKSLRHIRSHSPPRSKSDNEQELTPDYESTGTRIYIKRRRRPGQVDNDPRASSSSLPATSSVNKPGSETDVTPPSPLAIKKFPASADSEFRRGLKKTFTEEDGPAMRRRPSTRKRSKTAEFPIKIPALGAEAMLPPKVFGNRIEGWLADTPDLFTENADSPLKPKPLQISKTRRGPREQDDDRYSADDMTESGALTSADGRSDISRSTTPALQRRGARRDSRSPTKSRTYRDRSATMANPVMSGALPGPSPTEREPQSNKIPRRSIAKGSRPLSTIPSIETFRSRQQQDSNMGYQEGSMLSRASDGDTPIRTRSGLKRRLTKHENLMSVLSMSRDDSHPIAQGRSLRHRKPATEPATIGELMNDLSADEIKYQRELRTLVDGVIPVLLQNVLSGSETSTKPRMFNHPINDPSVTKPIVDMGVSLERLKTTHKRIPLHEPTDLLSWAEGASKIYSEYLRNWRLGFKDIVVNLLPAQEPEKRDGSPSWDHDLPRNKDGDLVGGDGQRVDVAYLLKRPLVRLKYLAQTFKGIEQMETSPKAGQLATMYQDLVQAAKKRVNDENARLEDEAAANIDPTRARDPRSLAPITGVTIDSTRCVRARDYFDMELTHSSGQQLGCKIEIIYRDDAPERGTAGDILFCEISASGRWLLFPPMPISLVSARKAEKHSELVVMIRGYLANARQWREVMLLRANDDRASSEWLQMLGSTPLPPRLSKRSSFNMLKAIDNSNTGNLSPSGPKRDTEDRSREPSLREIEVPIGERAKSSSRIWDASEVNSVSNEPVSTAERRAKAARYRSTPTSPVSRRPPTQGRSDNESPPRYFYDEARRDQHGSARPRTAHARSKSDWSEISGSRVTQDYSVWLPSSERTSDGSSTEEDDKPIKRPSLRRRTSSVPSLDMPTIPKLRKHGHPGFDSQHPGTTSETSSFLSESTNQSDHDRYERDSSSTPRAKPTSSRSTDRTRSKQPERPSPQAASHTRPTSLGNKTGMLPSLTPAFMRRHRRSSSPLKHEYEPSTASDSLSDSDISAIDDDDSITSESSTEQADAEVVSVIGDLRAFHNYTNRPYNQSQQLQQKAAPKTVQSFSLPSASLAPSESASQSPYRTVPPTDVEPAKTIACIFCWSERGTWESLHPQECSIYVTPGLIEAFDITQAQSVSLDEEARTPTAKGVRPLVALELTPLVPLRRGTALDISIRSPPSANSLIRTGNNVMFRSHTPEDCERLYTLINRARIDNPTYLALQKARGPVQQSNWGEVMDRRNADRTASTPWWHLGSRKSSTYRSKGSRTLSIAATESSVGTMNSALSALRIFSSGSRMFNIGKSTITSRDGTRSTNSESLSSGMATPLPIDPRLGTPVGITNAKIRLYLRDIPSSKWRDLGAARLTVMIPPRQDPVSAADPKTIASEKRILIYGKSEGETLLDATLGESSFERVARTGIAVSVWEEVVGPNGEAGRVSASGGVLNARIRVYMIQMKSERDAAYTFGLVGKLRY